MAAVADQGTTFNLPNFVGELFKLTPTDTPFLSMIGGLTGGKSITSKVFTWQTTDNNAAAQTSALEGADPTYEERDRAEVSNVLQIFQYGVEVSYTKRAAVGQLGDYAASRVWSIMGNQPVQDELSHQLMLKTERAARDVEYSFLRGAYAMPVDNATARTTRGMRNAISTNEEAEFTSIGSATFDFTGGGVEDEWTVAGHGLKTGDEVQFTAVGSAPTEFLVDTPYWVIGVDADTFQLASSKDNAIVGTPIEGTADTTGTWTLQKANPLTTNAINNLLRTMYDNAAPFRNPVIFLNAFNKQRFSDLYGYAPESRTVGGVNIQQVETDFGGTLGIVLDRHMLKSDIYFADMSVISPNFLAIPEKGHFFGEPLSQTGAAWRWQLYGEIGLEYGPEQWHGKITGLTTAP